MDPVTHSLLGAVAARAVVPGALRARTRHQPGLAGAFAALLPDLDRLIYSQADPLLHMEFHRHFTHALTFVPVGGVIAALPWLLRREARLEWRTYVAAATVGYGTHGVLDASTTYGTLLLWPFSDARIGWNLIAIVDPAFTLILLAGLLAAWRPSGSRSIGPAERRRRPVAALLAALVYLGAGAWQRDRALDVQRNVAAGRGHTPVRAEVFPGFGTNIIWRSLYEANGTLYMDRLRVPWMGEPAWSPGTSVVVARESDLPGPALADTRSLEEFRRFQWFSGGWIGRSDSDPALIGDARYSLRKTQFEPVWGIRLHPGQDPPVAWVDYSRARRLDVRDFWSEVVGRAPEYRPLRTARE